MPSSAAMFGTDSAMSSLGRQDSSLRITATQRDCVATGMTAIRWLTFNAPAEWTPTFPQGRWAKGGVDEVGADGFDDGVLVVEYVDVGRRGQLGGGDKRADSCDRHEARQGSPPFNPAQDQLGRDDMVAGEDGLADFCEFGMRSTRRRRDRPPCRDSAPGSRRAHRWHQSRRGGGSAKKNRTPARQAAMPACLSWVLSLSKDLPRPRCER